MKKIDRIQTATEIIEFVKRVFEENINEGNSLSTSNIGHNFNSDFRTAIGDNYICSNLNNAITLLMKYETFKDANDYYYKWFMNWLDKLKSGDSNDIPMGSRRYLWWNFKDHLNQFRYNKL
jgi:hypothetical protein